MTGPPATGPHAVRNRHRARLETVLRFPNACVQAVHVLDEPARRRAVRGVDLQFEQVAQAGQVRVHGEQVAHRVMRREGGRIG